MITQAEHRRRAGRAVRPARADVRAEVLVAAREVFAEAGYHRASLETIASRAGFSKGAVYSNFTSKDDLFLALLGEEAMRRASSLEGVAPRAGDLDVGLRRMAEGLLAMADDSAPNLLFAEFRAHAARDTELAATMAGVRGLLVDAVADRLDQAVRQLGGRLRVPRAEAATILLALVNGLALESVGMAGPPVSATALTAVLRGLVA